MNQGSTDHQANGTSSPPLIQKFPRPSPLLFPSWSSPRTKYSVRMALVSNPLLLDKHKIVKKPKNVKKLPKTILKQFCANRYDFFHLVMFTENKIRSSKVYIPTRQSLFDVPEQGCLFDVKEINLDNQKNLISMETIIRTSNMMNFWRKFWPIGSRFGLANQKQASFWAQFLLNIFSNSFSDWAFI